MRLIRDASETDPELVSYDNFDATLAQYYNVKNKINLLTDELNDLTEIIAGELEVLGRKSYVSDGIKFTLVQAERTKINEDALKKALGAVKFRKLCKQVVDQSKVKEAINNGELDPVVLAQHSEVVLNRPSIRFTKVGADE